jgi:PAS domain S-box-containing protein
MTQETFPPHNDFEADMPTTEARSSIEARIEAIRAQGGIFVEAVRATRMPMAVTDPSLPGNPIVFANEAFLQVSGYSMAEILGQQPHFMNGARTDAADAVAFRKALEENRDAVIETIQYRKDGTAFTASVLLSAFKGPDGRTAHQFLSYLDVTRRVEAETSLALIEASEARLRASEERFRMLAETIEDVFYIRDLDREGLEYLSPSYERVWGRPTAELLADLSRFPETVHEDDRELRGHGMKAQRPLGPVTVEYRIRRPDGSIRHILDRTFPIAGSGGKRLAGVAADITERKRAEKALRESEERQAFLLKLSDALRPLADAGDIQATTTRLLGEHLGVDRAMYAEVTGGPGAESGIIRGQFVRPATPGRPAPEPFPDRFTYETYGAEVMARRYSGEGVAVADVNADAGFDATERAAWATVGVQAAIVAPLVKSGRLVAELGVHSETPRAWTESEIALVREVGERTWAAAERARAEAATCESKARYRALFESMDEAYAVVEVLKDEGGGWTDFRFIEVNPAFIHHTSMPHPVGKTATELLGTPNPRWTQLYGRALDTGEALRLEEAEPTLGKTFDLNIFALDRTRNRVAVLFTDITERKRAEAALRESEERYRTALRMGRMGSWETDLEAGIRHWSPEGMALFGIDLPDGRGRVGGADDEWRARLHPEEGDVAVALFRALARQDRAHVEYRILRPNGELVCVFGHAQVLKRGADGRVQRLLNVAADITESRKAQEALRASEERFRSFAENSEDTLWIFDAETQRLDYLSPAFEAMWGESRERILSDLARWEELLHPADRERALKGMPILLKGKSFQQEYRVVRPSDGATRWILDTGFPIRDDEGRMRRVGGIAQDITARKEAEQELRRSRRRLRELVEGIPQLVWRAVDGGKWTWASPQWTDYTGLGDEASAGWGWLDAVHPDDQDLMVEAWERATKTRGLDAECRLRHRASGSYRWFAFRSRPIDPEVDEEELEWLGTSTEIHELRQLQEEQKVLVRELQHRTRNLMAIIASIARQTGARAESLDEFLPAFDNRLSALSRVQSLLSQPGDAPIALGELLKLELDALGAAVGSNRIQLQGPDAALPHGSVQTLALALHELATNARKYGALAAEDGTLSVHWTIGQAAGETRLTLEWVEDRGSFQPPATTSGGYGRQLIEKALPRVLGAETRYEIGERGVRCLISIPL